MNSNIPHTGVFYKMKKGLFSNSSTIYFFLIILMYFGFPWTTFLQAQSLQSHQKTAAKSPANQATNVNPDTKLVLTFSEKPILHTTGQIRVYDAANDELVDLLDLSIAPGPRNTRTPAPYDSLIYEGIPDSLFTVYKPDTISSHVYQKNYIGSNTEADAYHFYPVLIDGHTATINLHNNRLDYGKTYYVQIDAAAFSFPKSQFEGISGKTGWTFSTKPQAPSIDSQWLVVAADGSGDFNTVQGAIDFVPENNQMPRTIFIKNGRYEEVVFFRNKHNLTFLGENREGVLICYANNGVFNNKKMSPDPVLAGGYHNIRAIFGMNNSDGVQIANLTIRSLGEKPAQAEALLIKGKQIIVNHVNIEGSGDALQASGNIYVTDSKIQGFGDNVLGYGAVFFNHCDFVSTYGPHLWVRNTLENHGNVLVNCTLRTIGDVETTIARAPNSNGKTYPYVEAVLINCKLEGIRPEGWGKVADVTDDIRYWEFGSTNLSDGLPVSISDRHPVSRQLNWSADSTLIKNYRNPAFVLEGWSPEMAPFIVSQPTSVITKKRQTATFEVKCASIQKADYQWYKNDKPIEGATDPVLVLSKVKARNEAYYSVSIQNNKGSVKSEKALLTIE